MELSEIRKEIDGLDDKLLELFIKRMELCRSVAEYKRRNSLPIFQCGREEQVIDSVRSRTPDELKESSEKFFRAVMDISKEYQKKIIGEQERC